MSTAAELIEAVERMTVLELVDLKKELEDRWGILTPSMIPPTQNPIVVVGDDLVDEQTEFSVLLQSFGTNKIAVIKAVRELTSLGLKEAKDLVESAPVSIRDGLPKDEAEVAMEKLRDAGATVAISPDL